MWRIRKKSQYYEAMARNLEKDPDTVKFAINLASDSFCAAISEAVGLPKAISSAKFGPDIIANLLPGSILFITSLIKDVDFISIPFAQFTKMQFFLIIFFKGFRVD